MFCRVNIEICFSSDIAGLSICIFLEEFHFLLIMSETNFIQLKFRTFFCLWWVLFKYFWILYTNNEMAGLSCVGHTLVFVVLCRSYMGAILVFFVFFFLAFAEKEGSWWLLKDGGDRSVGMINTVFQLEHKEIACKWNGCYKLYSDVIFIDQ